MSTSKSPLTTTDALDRRDATEPSGPSWDAWSNLVTKAYTAVSQPGLWPEVFSEVREALALPDESGTLVLHDDGDVRYVDLGRPALGLTHLNPTDAFGKMSLSRRAFALAHLLDPSGQGAVFEDWDQLSRATEGARHLSALELFVQGRPAWQASSRELAARLLPHLHGALRLHRNGVERRRRESMLSTVVDRFSSELLLVDPDARLLYANHAAAERLATMDALRAHEGRLQGRDFRATRDLERSIRRRARSTSQSTTCLRLEGHFGPVLLWLQSLEPGVVAIRIAGNPNAPVSSSVLERAFELTSEEARVAFLFACGLTTREIGERLGLQQGQVRRRLAGLCEKTGARRQVELMKLLSDARPALR